MINFLQETFHMSLPSVMIMIFVLGYVAIIFEHQIKVNKSATALITAVFCWILITLRHVPNNEVPLTQLHNHLGNISQIIVFLLGAMTIVELINAYDGFKFITNFIETKDKRKLLWIVSFITFFVSALLDNLTAAIVMILLLRRLMTHKKERFVFASMIIIAANSGGVWSPIGDVTTTMLWIDHRVTSIGLVTKLFLPSLISMIIPLIILSLSIKKDEVLESLNLVKKDSQYGAKRVLTIGIMGLIFVPILHDLTGLPPYMGMMLGLGIMWTLTDLIHQERHYLTVTHILTKIDISSILFFLGVLLSVAALETMGLLEQLALWMNGHWQNKDIVLAGMGIISSIIDNVPITAGVMGMYDLTTNPIDSKIWEMAAYCLGTGGSLLIIGSAAGVVVMGMEHIRFSTYLRKVAFPALLGYLGGLVFLLWTY